MTSERTLALEFDRDHQCFEMGVVRTRHLDFGRGHALFDKPFYFRGIQALGRLWRVAWTEMILETGRPIFNRDTPRMRHRPFPGVPSGAFILQARATLRFAPMPTDPQSTSRPNAGMKRVSWRKPLTAIYPLNIYDSYW